jgi:hypothetical protein
MMIDTPLTIPAARLVAPERTCSEKANIRVCGGQENKEAMTQQRTFSDVRASAAVAGMPPAMPEMKFVIPIESTCRGQGRRPRSEKPLSQNRGRQEGVSHLLPLIEQCLCHAVGYEGRDKRLEHCNDADGAAKTQGRGGVGFVPCAPSPSAKCTHMHPMMMSIHMVNGSFMIELRFGMRKMARSRSP